MKAILALLIAAALPALAATPIPGGKWSFAFRDARGQAERPVRVYTYRPRQCDTTCPILFVMAGAKRDAYEQLGHWELAADRHGFMLVAPELLRRDWPGAAAYELGDVAAQGEREKWTYAVVEHLFDEVRDGQSGYAIFGRSAGARFVERLALLRPDNRATVGVAANPGWHLVPEWRKDRTKLEFPYSLVGSPAGEAELRRALAKRMILLVAEKDAEPDEERLGQSAGAKLQGEGGIERGENFFKAATAAAKELGVPLAWELHELPDNARDGEPLARHLGPLLFGKS